jgi:hypothetical protein
LEQPRHDEDASQHQPILRPARFDTRFRKRFSRPSLVFDIASGTKHSIVLP